MHRIENEICIVKAPGQLTLSSPIQFKKDVMPLFDNPEINGMVINCEGVSFIDSYGIGVIVSMFKRAKEIEKKFALSNLSKHHIKLFAMTGLDEVIDIVDSEEQAMQNMGT